MPEEAIETEAPAPKKEEQRYPCDCGASYTRRGKAGHFSSWVHKDGMARANPPPPQAPAPIAPVVAAKPVDDGVYRHSNGRQPGEVFMSLGPKGPDGRQSALPDKEDWTIADMWARYPHVMIRPQHNIPVIVNGVRINFFAGKTMKVPSVYADVYNDFVEQTATAHLPKQESDISGLGQVHNKEAGGVVALAAGGLGPV